MTGVMSLPPWDADWVSRRNRLDPEAFLRRLGLGEGATMVDVGSGGGFFSLAAARIVGGSGRVVAIDNDSAAIERLRSVAPPNVETILGTAERTQACDGCADFVLIANALHDFADPAAALGLARECLKPSGLLANLDWHARPTAEGPPLEKRFPRAYAEELVVRAGLHVQGTDDVADTHYVIRARRANAKKKSSGGETLS